MKVKNFFSFPNPVNDKAARTVVVKTRGPNAPPWPGPAASGQPYT